MLAGIEINNVVSLVMITRGRSGGVLIRGGMWGAVTGT